MIYSIDWERIKTEVDLEQYFLFKQGAIYQFDKYKKAYVQNSTSKDGDIIRFFKHERTGIKMYYSIVYNDSGDIIQFIKKRILKNFDASAEEINRELKDYLGIATSEQVFKSINMQSNLHEPFVETKKYLIYGNIIPKIEQHLPYLISFRKLSQKVLSSALFHTIFFTYKTSCTESLGFYIKDIAGNVVGINRVQTSDDKYFNKKWFDKDSKNGVGFTFSQFTEHTETLSIFESIFDAISFHEIYNEKSIQYVSTNGELGFRKAQLIKAYFEINQFKKVFLCNDNDSAGFYFNLCIITAFIPCINSIKKAKNNITIEISELYEDSPIKILKQFFQKTDQKHELKEDSELPQSYFTETLSPNSVTHYFMIGNSKESIKFFTDLLFRLWNLDSFITIKTSMNKDFNEDLITSKNTENG